MAISHISLKRGVKGNGRKHALYIAGSGKYSDRDDVVFCSDFNLPSWAGSGVEFFDACDQLERKSYTTQVKAQDGSTFQKLVKGRSYLELEFAIPRESPDPVTWAQSFAKSLLGERHAYRLAIHNKAAADGGTNIHAHLMFSDRILDGLDRSKEQFFKRAASTFRDQRTKVLIPTDPGRGGCKKDRKWNSRSQVQFVRSAFEEHVKTVVPEFRMQKSKFPEPKVGPLKNGQSDPGRKKRQEVVTEIRNIKKQLNSVERAISESKISQAAKSNLTQKRCLAFYPYEHKWMLYRKQLISAYYGQVIFDSGLAKYWKVQMNGSTGLSFQNRIGQIDDLGEVIFSKHGNDQEIAAIIQIAKLKGWSSICFDGPPDFKERAMIFAKKCGLHVATQSLDDRSVWGFTESTEQPDADLCDDDLEEEESPKMNR